ncbi:Conserved oligomeric Golgi complex subunit 7 [Trichoplax sp. H2]|nr:Conserved oligomeric Golgi complex subunit 7 [Trichoplax sp. H2]|eukprot:RDD43473.1 Conserved oligomeric Golgi complex subunit 7 [Trichoplax sp. H2]
MDFSRFSDSDFDVKKWVNAALRSNKDPNVALDAHASTLVMKLQLYIQEANNTLEEESQQMVQNLPRVLREIEGVYKETTLLKDQMNSVKNDIEKVEIETSESMKMLVELDSIKSRMQAASNVIQEADNWSVLVSDVDGICKRGDIDAIASMLTSMQHSLEVLNYLPDYEKRKQTLEKLKDKLEALVSPKLIAAFNDHDIEATRDYVRIFQDIYRMNFLERYYNHCRKSVLQDAWSALIREDMETLPMFEEFYDLVLSSWHAEVSWCVQIFPNAIDLVNSVLAQSLSALDPSIYQYISDYINDFANPVMKIEQLTAFRKCTFRFAEGLDTALSNQQINDPRTTNQLVQAIHSPFTKLLLKYSDWEKENLMANLKSLSFEIDGILDTVSRINEYVGKAFTWANEARNRCFDLTQGCGIYGLGSALETYFIKYLNEHFDIVKNLRDLCRIGVLSNITAPSPASQNTEFQDDWTVFQNAFRLIQTCGDIIIKSNSLSARLQKSINNQADKLLAPANLQRTLVHYNYLVDDDSEEMSSLSYLVERCQQEGHDFVFLPSVRQRCCDLNESCHLFAFDLIFSKVQQQLSAMPMMEARFYYSAICVWSAEKEVSDVSNEDLPTFISPSSYITQIGDYLLNLPQQLEPFATQNNPSLEMALKEGKLPYPDTSDNEDTSLNVNDTTIYWLGAVARGTVLTYVENIMKIPTLTDHAARQLIEDIEYLFNILEALEISPGIKLKQIVLLLKSPSSEFQQSVKDQQILKEIADGIAKIRNINL